MRTERPGSTERGRKECGSQVGLDGRPVVPRPPVLGAGVLASRLPRGRYDAECNQACAIAGCPTDGTLEISSAGVRHLRSRLTSKAR
jgi:hypothetical protein